MKYRYVFLLILVLSVSLVMTSTFTRSDEPEPSITYTETTMTSCLEGICTVSFYSSKAFESVDDLWYTLPELTTVKWQNGGFNISYNGQYWVLLVPSVVYNGQEYSTQEIHEFFPNVVLKDYIKPQKFDFKFALNYSNIPQNLLDNLDYVLFRIGDSNGLTLNDITRKDNLTFVIKDKVKISFGDLIKNSYTANIINRTLYIGNLSENYINDILSLDPTIVFNDVPSENMGDTYWWQDDADNHGTSWDLRGASALAREAQIYLKFNISQLPSNASVSYANLSLYIHTNELDFPNEGYMVTFGRLYNNYTVGGIQWWQGENASCQSDGSRGVPCWRNKAHSNTTNLWAPYVNISGGTGEPMDEHLYWDVTEAVQSAVDDLSLNISFLGNSSITSGSPMSADIYEFYSSEFGPVGARPILTVSYTEIAPTIDIETLYPTSDIDVNVSEFFNYTVKITCRGADCGTVNLSLDPFVNLNGSNVLEDAQANQATPTQNSGGFSTVRVLAGGMSHNYFSYFKFNTSYLGTSGVTTITDSQFCAYISFNGMDGGDSMNVSAWMVPNSYAWVETGINWNNKPEGSEVSATNLGSQIIDNTVSSEWRCWGVTQFVQDSISNDNITIMLNATLVSGSLSDGDFISIDTKEGSTVSLRPYLNITYSGAKGLISNVVGATPFYTNITNPYAISLDKGESATVVFWVNASGSSGTTREFWAYANLTTNLAISNISSKVNISIVTPTPPPGGDTCTYDTGDWVIMCTHMCNISSEVNMDASSSLKFMGTGDVTITANIQGFDEVIISGNSTTNRCNVLLNGGSLG